jgi:hypothetical protein
MDLFPGLDRQLQLWGLRDRLGDDALPGPVESLLQLGEEITEAGVAGLPVAEHPASVLGATRAVRAQGEAAAKLAGAYALTPGPPWLAFVPISGGRGDVVSVDEGAVEPVKQDVGTEDLLRLLEELGYETGRAVPDRPTDNPAASLERETVAPAVTPSTPLTKLLAARGLSAPPGLLEAWQQEVSRPVANLLLRGEDGTVGESFDVLASGAEAPPADVVPLAVVDEESVAVVSCGERDSPSGPTAGLVHRWFLRPVSPEQQLELLDVDAVSYLCSLDEELSARKPGLDRILDEIGPHYEQTHITRDKRPRDHVLRPVRLACQNVVVGMAAFAHESSFDGLSVLAWQTCEVPHVATHEGNRTLAALTLCDAFRNGGTMEIRFDCTARIKLDGHDKPTTYRGHPEGRVPASLRRFGRTLGVELGAQDPAAISPAESRALFRAVTRMPADLAARAEEAVRRDGLAPERLCFVLLSQLWREIELDVLLACSERAASILDGGADWRDRGARQAESEVCRAASLAGMLHRRLNSTDDADVGDEIRPVEDRTRGVTWEVDPRVAAVRFSGLTPGEPLPWSRERTCAETLVVLPRSQATGDVMQQAMALADRDPVAVELPADAPEPDPQADVAVLRCPDRLADLDRTIEEAQLTLRVSR